MALFVLRKGFQVISSANGGGRIVHVRTGDTLTLSAPEVMVLARATAGTPPGDDAFARGVVRKFSDLGVLLARLEPEGIIEAELEAPAPSAAALEKTVPQLAPEAKLAAQPGTLMFELSLPESGRVLLLHDFETSIVRMLDGRRSPAEVVEAGQRLGIPLTLESLAQFIEVLANHRLLLSAPATGAPDDKGLWPLRQKWSEGVRGLFQAGLKKHREGRYSEAAADFDRMLLLDPDNDEARELLALGRRLERLPPNRGPPVVVQLDGASVPVAAVTAPMPPRVAPAVAVAPPMPPSTAALPEITAPRPPPAPRPQAVPVAPATSNPRPLLWVAGGLVVLALGIGGYFLFPQSAPVQTSEVRRIEPPAPPPVVKTPEPAPVEVQPVQPPAAVEPAEDAGATVAAPIDTAPALDASVPAAEIAGREFKIVSKGRVSMFELVAAADGTVQWSAQPDQHLRRGAVAGTLRNADGTQTDLVVGKEGLLNPRVRDGDEVKSGAPLASLLYLEAFLRAEVDGDAPTPEWPCEVVSAKAGARAPCKVVTAVKKGSGSLVTATTEPRWFDAAPDAVLRLGPPR